MNQRRRLMLTLAAVAAVVVLFLLYRPATRPPLLEPLATAPRRPGRPHSFWTVRRAVDDDAAAPAAIPSPSQPAKTEEPTLAVLVEDATGGPIASANIAIEGKSRGFTDADGWLRLPIKAIPRAASLDASAPGYARGRGKYEGAGEVRLQLLPGSQIAGIVVESVTGRLVADVTVFATEASTTTDQAGRFVLRDLPAGLVRIEARGPHHFGALRDPIALGLGKVVNDVRLEVQSAFAIRGQVLASGKPLRGMAKVGGCGREVQVGEDGRYEITGVAAGHCALRLHADGPAEFLSNDRTFSIDVKDADVTQDIDLGERHDLTVVLADRRGRPISNHRVEATQSDEQMLISNRCTTGDDGRCTFFGLQPGSVELQPANSDLPKRKVAIPATEGIARLVLDETGGIEGRLTSPDGRPPSPRGIVAQGRKGGHGMTQSALDGTFSLAGLPADHYEIHVRDESFTWDTTQPPEAKAQVPLGVGERRSNVVISLRSEDAHLSGKVLDVNDRPMFDVLVTLDVFHHMMVGEGAHIGGRSMTVTGRDGSFAFDRLSPAYHYDLVAHAPDGRRARVRDQAVGGPVILHLITLARLTVTLDESTRKSPIAFVQVFDGAEAVDMSDIADGEAIHFDALTPGRRTVRSSSGASAVVDLVAGQLATVKLTSP